LHSLLEDLINLQWNSARVLPNPDLLFHWMDPIVGIQRLLLNPRISERMKYDPSELSAEEIRAGHFLTGKIAQAAINLMPRFDVPVRPLFIGWWADATNVSCGGMSLVVINRLQTNLLLFSFFFFIIIFFFLSSAKASLRGKAHPILQWIYNVPSDVWTAAEGSTVVGFIPEFSVKELPSHMQKYVATVRAAVFHRSIALLSESLNTNREGYHNGKTTRSVKAV
jgi:hypothetical protein